MHRDEGGGVGSRETNNAHFIGNPRELIGPAADRM